VESELISKMKSGRIRIVGAGPGDPGLMTVAAMQALAEAEVVVADRLCPPAITALIGPNATLFVARKLPGHAAEAQAELDKAVLAAAAAGKDVVRLKGGDPFLFGRGGEEVILYRTHGHSPELIPGLSSCIAGPAAAMIPVTHRGVADRLMVITAHGKANAVPDLPPFLPSCTYVFMMGVGRLQSITDGLVDNQAFPPSLPTAIVQEAWQPGQRTVYGTLGTISAIATAAGVKAPAVIVVGDVSAAGLLAGNRV
jgi:uroporphyrin-III C-methyltransferase